MATSSRTSLLALLIGVLLSLVYPSSITYTAAPLVMLMYNASLASCLWAALATGFLLDAIELSPRFGFLGLSYLLACRLLYSLRLYFFKDSLVTLPVMTLLFSFILQAVVLLTALFFDLQLPRIDSLGSILSPFYDAFFACALFMLPTLIWDQYRLRQRRKRYSDDT